MESLNLLTNFINGIFIKSLFISILSIMLVGKLSKTDTRNALLITKVLTLIYATLNISCYFIAYFSPVNVTIDSFSERVTGTYNFAYYLMVVPNTILPLFLIFRRLGNNKYVLLILSLLMNMGWAFELFVIYGTNTHRDYNATQPSFNILWFVVLNGIFVGSVIYAVGNAIKRKYA